MQLLESGRIEEIQDVPKIDSLMKSQLDSPIWIWEIRSGGKSNLSWRFILMSYINENWRTDVRKQNIKYKFVFLDDEVFEEVGLRTHACSK